MIISVIVPFLDEELYIERCIKSLLRQDFDPGQRELIFVDNGSTDKSPDIVRRYPELTLLRDPVPNVYAARNKALAIAKGDILAFTDADCEVSSDWLSGIHKRVRETGAAIVLGKRSFPPHSSIAAMILQDYENAKVEYLLARSMTEYYFGFTNNMAVTKSLLKEIGGFREDTGTEGDTELVQRCISSCPESKIVYGPRVRIVHLEIISAMTWLSKLFAYGKTNIRVQNAGHAFKELGLEARLRIFGYLIKTYHYSLLRSVLAMLVLMAGSFFYMAGQGQSLFLRMSKTQRKY